MGSPFFGVSGGPRFTPRERACVSDCVDRHLATLSELARTGLARPIVTPLFDHLAYLIPRNMWDTTPDERGFVRWKPIILPEGITHSLTVPRYQHLLPSTLEAYLQSFRLCRFAFPIRDRVVCMPATPDHNPPWDINRLLSRYHWGPLADFTGFVPFAATDDETTIYCADSRQPGTDGDAPVVSFASEVLFRLLPRLSRHADPQGEAQRAAVPEFDSVASLLRAGCLGGSTAPEPTRLPLDRRPTGQTEPFDWSPWLSPQPADGEVGPDYSSDVAPVPSLREHLDRIAEKLARLRAADPVFLIPGAEAHHHVPNPVLLPDERAAFERDAGVTLPVAYAEYLARVGNGGFGPWIGLVRLEADILGGANPVRVSDPFPHRKRWNPRPKNPSESELADYMSPKHVAGTVRLGFVAGDDRQFATALLVVSGPERGHIWYDDRRRQNGIRPVCRRGPCSFLKWQEEGIDNYLKDIDGFYAQIAEDIGAQLIKQPRR